MKLIEILPLNTIEIMLPIMEQIVDRQYIQARIYYRFTKKLKYNFGEYIKKNTKKQNFYGNKGRIMGMYLFQCSMFK